MVLQQDAKSYPGADGDSDHNLVLYQMRLKALKIRKKLPNYQRQDPSLKINDKTQTAIPMNDNTRVLLKHDV